MIESEAMSSLNIFDPNSNSEQLFKCNSACLFCQKSYPTGRHEWMQMIESLSENNGNIKSGIKLGIFTLSILNHYFVSKLHDTIHQSGRIDIYNQLLLRFDDLYTMLSQVNEGLLRDLEYIIQNKTDGAVDPKWHICLSLVTLLQNPAVLFNQEQFNNKNNHNKSQINKVMEEKVMEQNQMRLGTPDDDKIQRNQVNTQKSSPIYKSILPDVPGVPSPSSISNPNPNTTIETIKHPTTRMDINNNDIEKSKVFQISVPSRYSMNDNQVETMRSMVDSANDEENNAQLYQAANLNQVNSSPITNFKKNIPSTYQQPLSSSSTTTTTTSIPNNGETLTQLTAKFVKLAREDEVTERNVSSADDEAEDEDDDDDEEYDEEDDESDFEWDDADDLQIDESAMSPNLLALLGLGGNTTAVETDWKPPNAAGLDNSEAIVNIH